MKAFKIILILIIGFVLIGCDETGNNNNNNNNNNNDDITEPSLFIEKTDYEIEEGGNLQLDVQVLDSDEDLGIIYSSSNPIVATVDTNGFVRALAPGFSVITAMLASYPDEKLEIIVTVLEPPMGPDIAKAIADFELIMEELNQIPEVVKNDLILKPNMHGRTITWSTSNDKVITRFGAVYRGAEDVQVDLTAKMEYKHIVEVFKKTVTVKKIEMPDLTNKKPIFAYSRQVSMRSEDLEKIDIVNFAFASVAGNRFSVTAQISTLVRQAHNNGARVVVSLGGGSDAGSNPFINMTSTKENRQAFINSMMNAIEQYNLDGIDYDWEYPNGEEQKNNFSLLLKETKEAFDASGRDLILTAAVAAGLWGITNRYDAKELNKYLDYLHVMTYDFNNWVGEAFGQTKHHAQLYQSKRVPGNGAHEGIMAYINGGVSPEKIIIGVAAYGRMATQITNSTDGLGASGFNPSQSINFENIYNLYYKNPAGSEYTYYYDEDAEAAWLFNGNTFISFDDERAINAKANYVFEKNLGGIMYWDYMNDPNGRILNYMFNSMNK